MGKTKHTSRSEAARALADVLRGNSLSQTLPIAIACVEDTDAAFLQQLCYGSCRHFNYLSSVLKTLLKKPLKKKDNDIEALLITGIYQLAFSRVPAYAAISETVATTKILHKNWAKALVNGVLRQYQRNREAIDKGLDDATQQWVTPAWLLQRLQKDWPDYWQSIAQTMAQQPPMTLRLNQKKVNAKTYLEQLAKAGIEGVVVSGIDSAIRLNQAQDVYALPGFQNGTVSVQDAGAQVAAPLMCLSSGDKVLDVCAAPGGKTGHMLELAEVDMWALDIEQTRLDKVKENLQRLSLHAKLMVADATKQNDELRQQQFDKILLDVPCSATGVIRRNPDIMILRRDSDIEKLVKLQAEIFDNIWPKLKVGGTLLYATCSVLVEENSQQIKKILQQYPDARLDKVVLDHSIDTGFGCQLLPNKNHDGFFYARLKKQTLSDECVA